MRSCGNQLGSSSFLRVSPPSNLQFSREPTSTTLQNLGNVELKEPTDFSFVDLTTMTVSASPSHLLLPPMETAMLQTSQLLPTPTFHLTLSQLNQPLPPRSTTTKLPQRPPSSALRPSLTPLPLLPQLTASLRLITITLLNLPSKPRLVPTPSLPLPPPPLLLPSPTLPPRPRLTLTLQPPPVLLDSPTSTEVTTVSILAHFASACSSFWLNYLPSLLPTPPLFSSRQQERQRPTRPQESLHRSQHPLFGRKDI